MRLMKKAGLSIALAVLVALVATSAVFGFSKWFSPWQGWSWNDAQTFTWQNSWTWNESVAGYQWYHAWEFELRGRDGHNINEYYCEGLAGWWSDLPSRYKEHDDDDYSFGSHGPDLINPGQAYSGWMQMNECDNPGIPAVVESEYGWDAGLDMIPIDHEQLDTSVPGFVQW